MASNDVKIKDLIIKVKAADMEKAAGSAKLLNKNMIEAASSTKTLNAALSKTPTYLQASVTSATALRRILSGNLSSGMVAQFALVNTELQKIVSKLQMVKRLTSITFNLQGLSSANTSAKKLSDNLGLASTSAKALAKSISTVASNMEKANSRATQLNATLASVAGALRGAGGGGAGDISKLETQLTRLNDTLELVLGTIEMMGSEMSTSASLMIDKLGDVNAGLELIRRSSKQAAEATQALGGSLSRLGRNSDRVTRGLANNSNHANGAARNFSKLARAGGSLSIAYAMIAANVFAISQAWSFLEKGDALIRMEKSASILANNVGSVTNDVVKMIREVSGFSVSYETAMRTAASATIYGFDTKTIEGFVKIARGASQVLGGDMTDFLNRLMKGTAKQERELLDELGIMVRVDKAQQDYATSLGKTVQQLTALEKQQSFANGVLKNGLDLYEELGDQLANTSSIEKATAAVSDLTRKFSQWIAITANPIIARIMIQTEGEEQYDKVAESYTKIQDLVKGSEGQLDKSNVVQGLKLLSDALEENSKFSGEAQESINSFISEARKLRDINEPGGFSDFGLFMLHLGDVDAVMAEKVKYATANQQDLNDKIKSSDSAVQNLLETFSKFSGLSPKELTALLPEISKINAQLVSTKKTAASIGSDIDKSFITLKGTVTTADILANSFASAKAEVGALDKILNSKLAKTIPGIAPAIRKLMDGVLQNAGVSDAKALDPLYDAYKAQADFEKQETARQKELAAASSKSLDSNLNSLSVNTANLAINRDQLKIAEQRIAVNSKDIEAQNLKLSSEAAIISLMQDRKELEYSMAQQAIENENLIRTATILLQDQTDATKNRLEAEQALATAKKKAALAGTAADSASAINESAQAEVALKDAIIEEAIAKEQLVSKQKVLLGYQKDTEAYLKGQISYQAEIYSAQEDLRQATSELAILQGAGLKYEERRLELMQQQAQAQRAISEARAKEITDKLVAEQRGSSRGDTGPISTAKRSMLEAEARMLALAKDATTAGTVAYTDAVEEFKQAKYEYEKALEEKTRAGTDTALGAFGSSSISSTYGLKGEELNAVLQSDSLSNYTTALDTISSYNPEITDMITNMGQLTNAFIAFGEESVSASQLVAPVLNTLSSAMSAASQGAINDIQNQIDMEKKLDGNSEESKAKIAKMEAEKAALQKKQAIQTIVVQTAAGMAQALGSMPYPYNLVAMGTVAAAGAMALKQAQSGNAIASSEDTASPESLTLGERSNRVDTSLAATAGESAYIRGDQGTGSIQNFTPRASGGKAYAGTTILAGENGPEPITLGMDATVTKNSDSRKATAQSIQLNINAVDAKSFQDLLATEPTFITSLVEASLNERGLSLG